MVFGVKLLSRSIAGRIVLSHVHASTLRRTRSLPKTWQCDELSARRSIVCSAGLVKTAWSDT